MRWGECKLICLQTMYANEGAALSPDDTNQEYLDAMPGKANEGMQQLALVGRPLLKEYHIRVGAAAPLEEPVPPAAQELTLPIQRRPHKIHLMDYVPRFRAVNRLLLETERGYGPAGNWSIEGDTTLVIPGEQEGDYTLWYRAYPQKVDAETPDETELDLTEDAAALLPIYMAAELYKDDSLALATVLRNEYEDGLGKLRGAYEETGNGMFAGMRTNTTGWW